MLRDDALAGKVRGTALPVDDRHGPVAIYPIPYLEHEAMEAFTVGLTVLLDGIQAAMAKDRR